MSGTSTKSGREVNVMRWLADTTDDVKRSAVSVPHSRRPRTMTDRIDEIRERCEKLRDGDNWIWPLGESKLVMAENEVVDLLATVFHKDIPFLLAAHAEQVEEIGRLETAGAELLVSEGLLEDATARVDEQVKENDWLKRNNDDLEGAIWESENTVDSYDQENRAFTAQVSELREALDVVKGCLQEVVEQHKDPNDIDYNECDIDECQWCVDATKAIDIGTNMEGEKDDREKEK